MWKYLRYGLLTAIGVFATSMMMTGGHGMWAGFFAAVVLAVGGDALFGDDLSEPTYGHKWLLNLQLYSNWPMLTAMTFVLAWHFSDGDPLGVGAALGALTGYDFFAAREANSALDLFGGALGLGLYYGVAGTNVGHELTHRTSSAPALIVGRWLLAFTSDASFAIEHVYGHHKHVATRQDPATSRRGESAYFFVLRSTVCSYLSAWSIERERLEKLGHSMWSWRNRMHRGNLMTATYALGFAAVVGHWWGALLFMAISLYGKAWLEFVNYTEHYGIVRVPGKPVEPRHSWNCNRRMSGYLLYNLTRHSHHHAMGEKPFWELRAYPEAPMMPYGYLTMIIVAAIPPLWNRIMIPRVLAWDATLATPEELEIAKKESELSGMKIFVEGLPAHQLPQITGEPLGEDVLSGAELASNDDAEVSFGDRLRSLFGSNESSLLTIESVDAPITVGPNTTILQAALEQGVPFPHNCRVGGCAACKCKVERGEVRQRTDPSYLLSAEELASGYVLACQSVPKTPEVTVSVPDMDAAQPAHPIVATAATITSLEPLTHDILELRLKLDAPIAFTAGQYADLHVEGVTDAPRSYSFAAASAGEGASDGVVFHVRKVDGGQFTTWLHEEASVGERLSLEGPYGDFWLRPSGAPILAIAGGSGMAPLKALLEQARQGAVARDVVYLFGARTEEDLYAVEEMEALAKTWMARMTFVPVLSDLGDESRWRGRRGMVTDHIEGLLGKGVGHHHVYMCGPPAMIDAAVEVAVAAGIADHDIHFDKFLDRSHLAASDSGEGAA